MMAQWLNIIITTILFPTVRTSTVSSMCGDPLNITVPLSCDADGQWIHVVEETYGAADPQTDKCSFSQGCPLSSLTSSQYMLRSSCNGPAAGNGTVCEEDVRATKEMVAACGVGTTISKVDVNYRCIPATAIISLCSNTNWTINTKQTSVFLATPSFSSPPVLNCNCTCEIRGIALGLEILDLQADVDPTLADPLTIRASTGEAWNTSGVCKKCYVERNNEMIFSSSSPGTSYTEFKVNFQDNHKPRQRAWLEIQGFNQNITVSCRVVNLTIAELTSSAAATKLTTTAMKTTPADLPPKTGSTATTTTNASVKTAATTTTANKAVPTILTTEAWSETTSAVKRLAQTDSTVITSSRSAGEHYRVETQSSISKDNISHDGHNIAVLIILIILAIVLTVTTLILGLLVWRRYQQIGRKQPETYTGHSSCNVFSLIFWYHSCHGNREKSNRSEHQTLQFADLATDDYPHGENGLHYLEEVHSENRVNYSGVSCTNNTGCNGTSVDGLKLVHQERANNLKLSADIASNAGNKGLLQSDNGAQLEDHADNGCPNHSKNHKGESTKRYTNEINFNRFETDSFGNTSAMTTQPASRYRANTKILQNETEDASGDLCGEVCSPKPAFDGNLDNVRHTAPSEQDVLQGNESEKALGIADKDHSTTYKRELKEGPKSLTSTQQKSGKGTLLLDTTFYPGKGLASLDNLAQDEDFGGREMASHTLTSHDSNHAGIENLEAGFQCDTAVRKEMGLQDSGEDRAKSKNDRIERNKGNKRPGVLKNKACVEKSQHDSESRKKRAEQAVARILGQTLQHITTQREELSSSLDQSEALTSDLQHGCADNTPGCQSLNDCDTDFHSGHGSTSADGAFVDMGSKYSSDI